MRIAPQAVARRRARRHRDADAARAAVVVRAAALVASVAITLPRDVARDRAARRRRDACRSRPTRRSRGRSTATTSARSSGSTSRYEPDALTRHRRPDAPLARGRGRATSVMTRVDAGVARAARAASGSFTVQTFTCRPRSCARGHERAGVAARRASTRRGAARACPCVDRGRRAPRADRARTTGTRSGRRARASRTRSTVARSNDDTSTSSAPPTTGPTTGRRRDRPRASAARGSGSLISTFTSRPAADVEHLGRASGPRGGPRARSASGQLGQQRRAGSSASWRTTSAPSAVRWTSSSTPSAPSSIARANRGNGVLRRLPVGAPVREHEHPAHHATRLDRMHSRKFLVSPLRAGARAKIVSDSERLEARPGTRDIGHTA